MEELKLGMVEARFADIVWQNEPMTTRELVALCEKELEWKRTTTYTVLKKLCEKGIFKTENSTVTATLRGHVDSIKSPAAGRIKADSVGEIVYERAPVDGHGCEILVRKAAE